MHRTQLWVPMDPGLPVCDFCLQSLSALWTMLGRLSMVTTPWGPVLKKLLGLNVGHPAFKDFLQGQPLLCLFLVVVLPDFLTCLRPIREISLIINI